MTIENMQLNFQLFVSILILLAVLNQDVLHTVLTLAMNCKIMAKYWKIQLCISILKEITYCSWMQSYNLKNQLNFAEILLLFILTTLTYSGALTKLLTKIENGLESWAANETKSDGLYLTESPFSDKKHSFITAAPMLHLLLRLKVS